MSSQPLKVEEDKGPASSLSSQGECSHIAGVLAHTHHLGSMRQEECHQFKASLVSIASSRMAKFQSKKKKKFPQKEKEF